MHRRSIALISSDEELKLTFDRIDRFRQQIGLLRQLEANPTNYRFSVEGYLAEVDRMNLEIREYLSVHGTGVE
jgi:hypothetical protein